MAGLSATITRNANPLPLTLDITAKGGADYMVANGDNLSFKRKNVTSLFGTPTATWDFKDNNGAYSGYAVSGTDGKPSPATFSVSSYYGGFTSAGQYFEVTAPAGLAERSLELTSDAYTGSSVSVTATLSDGSVSPLTLERDTDGIGTGSFALYELTYSAGSDGQTLTIRVTCTGSGNVVRLGHLWLSNEATGTQPLTPNLFTNTNTFYASTVGRSTVSLTAPLLANAQTFYAATVNSAYALTPALFTNANTFYNATVAKSYTASAGLFTNNSTIYSANVTYSNTLTPGLFTNTSTFYSPLIASGLALAPELFSNAQTFYGASVGVGAINLTPNLLSNTSQFYAPVVQQEGDPQLLAPSLVDSINTFFNATLSTTYTVSAELVTNASVIYAPVATASNQIVAQLLTNNQTFYGSVVISDQVLLSGLLTNANVFYPFILQNGDEVIFAYGKRLSKKIITSSKRTMNIQSRKRT